MHSFDYAIIQEMMGQVTLKLPRALHVNAFLPLLVILVPPAVFLGLYAYQEWQLRRSFNDYWKRKPARGKNVIGAQQAAKPQPRPNLIRADRLQTGNRS